MSIKFSIFLFLLCFAINIHTKVICEFSSSQLYYDIDKARLCIESIPHDDYRANYTLGIVEKVADQYAFKHIVKDSPVDYNLYHINVDLQKELSKLRYNQYTSEQSFLQNISDIFISLHDAHTLFIKGSCYNIFASQPLTLGSRLDDNGNQEIYIYGTYESSYADQYQDFDLKSLIGATVINLNHRDAISELVQFADKYGFYSKDPNAAFNYVLGQGYQIRSMKILDFPESNTLNYTLKLLNGSYINVELPWVAIAPDLIINDNGVCKSSRHLLQSPRRQIPYHHLLHEIEIHPKFKTVNTGNEKLLELSANPISIIPVNNDIIGLKVSSFVPDNNDEFLDTVSAVFERAKILNIPKLLIDFTGNGGGDICLGYNFIQLLTGAKDPVGFYDMVHSDLNDIFVKKGVQYQSNLPFYGNRYWLNPDDDFYNGTSYYYPGANYTRGNEESVYTELLKFNCPSINPISDYKFEKIVILTNGLCGSTCAVVTSHLQEVYGIETVAVGGVNERDQMQAFSFPGGMVNNNEQILNFEHYLGINQNDKNYIGKFLDNNQKMSYTMLEIYPWDRTTYYPIEFVFTPAKVKLPIWIPNSVPHSTLVQLYEKIIQYA